MDYLANPEEASEHSSLLALAPDEAGVLQRLDEALTELGEDGERLAVIARRAELATEEESRLYQALPLSHPSRRDYSCNFSED